LTLPAHLGYAAVALLVGAESLGILVPGETAILVAGVLARQGRLDLAAVLAIAAAAAIAGDNIAYALARRGARGLLVRRGPLLRQRLGLVREGERFFARYGGRSVALGRWVAFARVTVPWLAGASGMPPRRFVLWNALGGITWSASVGLAGYALGEVASAIFTSLTAVVLVAALAVALRAAWRRRGRRR
jgi:membrane-associated protein